MEELDLVNEEFRRDRKMMLGRLKEFKGSLMLSSAQRA